MPLFVLVNKGDENIAGPVCDGKSLVLVCHSTGMEESIADTPICLQNNGKGRGMVTSYDQIKKLRLKSD